MGNFLNRSSKGLLEEENKQFSEQYSIQEYVVNTVWRCLKNGERERKVIFLHLSGNYNGVKILMGNKATKQFCITHFQGGTRITVNSMVLFSFFRTVKVNTRRRFIIYLMF